MICRIDFGDSYSSEFVNFDALLKKIEPLFHHVFLGNVFLSYSAD